GPEHLLLRRVEPRLEPVGSLVHSSRAQQMTHEPQVEVRDSERRNLGKKRIGGIDLAELGADDRLLRSKQGVRTACGATLVDAAQHLVPLFRVKQRDHLLAAQVEAVRMSQDGLVETARETVALTGHPPQRRKQTMAFGPE